MDEVDRELSRAAEDARRDRLLPHNDNSAAQHRRASNEVERVTTHASSITTSSIDTQPDGLRSRSGVGISRVSTQRDLERHPTALSRIQTARSQHNATVGQSLSAATGRSSRSRKPLPAFGAGKPFPPPLPDQEEYVVEFDGPDDPYHAQNWPTKKK